MGTGAKMLQSGTTSPYLLLLLLLPFSSSLPLLLSDLLPSQPTQTTSSICAPESSKLSSSVTAIGNLLSNKAAFLGEQSSLLGHQMEVLKERLQDLKSDGEENAAA